MRVPEMQIERVTSLTPVSRSGKAHFGKEVDFQLSAPQASVEFKVCPSIVSDSM
jgi:hypothetical protein